MHHSCHNLIHALGYQTAVPRLNDTGCGIDIVTDRATVAEFVNGFVCAERNCIVEYHLISVSSAAKLGLNL